MKNVRDLVRNEPTSQCVPVTRRQGEMSVGISGPRGGCPEGGACPGHPAQWRSIPPNPIRSHEIPEFPARSREFPVEPVIRPSRRAARLAVDCALRQLNPVMVVHVG